MLSARGQSANAPVGIVGVIVVEVEVRLRLRGVGIGGGNDDVLIIGLADLVARGLRKVSLPIALRFLLDALSRLGREIAGARRAAGSLRKL